MLLTVRQPDSGVFLQELKKLGIEMLVAKPAARANAEHNGSKNAIMRPGSKLSASSLYASSSSGASVLPVVSRVTQLAQDATVACEVCGDQTMERLISAAGFRLKGGGWYETDFKSDKRRNVASDGTGTSSGGKSDDGGAGSSDSGSTKASDGGAAKSSDSGSSTGSSAASTSAA